MLDNRDGVHGHDAVQPVLGGGRPGGGEGPAAGPRAVPVGAGGARGSPAEPPLGLLLPAVRPGRSRQEVPEHDRVRAGPFFRACCRDRWQTR